MPRLTGPDFLPMNYGRIARWYQPLSKAVFGNTLVDAQRLALQSLSAGSRLLIAGGGDGEVLKHLQEWNGPIDFVEISEEMIRLAQRKPAPNTRFIHRNIFDFQPDNPYNIILFPFLLDNFLPEDAKKLIDHLRPFLVKEGQIIIIDYTETPSSWQKILLQAMYFFFRIAVEVRVKALPPIEKIMQENGFQKTRSFSLYRRFIEVKYYTRIFRSPGGYH